MILKVIPLVQKMSFHDTVKSRRRPEIRGVCIGKTNGNVRDNDAHQGFLVLRRWLAGYVYVAVVHFVEMGYDVEGWEADGCVDFGDVFGEGLFCGAVFECAWWVVYLPEGHGERLGLIQGR